MNLGGNFHLRPMALNIAIAIRIVNGEKVLSVGHEYGLTQSSIDFTVRRVCRMALRSAGLPHEFFNLANVRSNPVRWQELFYKLTIAMKALPA